MPDPFEMVLKLREEFSPQAQKVKSSLSEVESGLSRASAELRKLDQAASLAQLGKISDPLERQRFALRLVIDSMREEEAQLRRDEAAKREATRAAQEQAQALQKAAREKKRLEDEAERAAEKRAREEKRAAEEAVRALEKETRAQKQAAEEAADKQRERWTSVATGLHSIVDIVKDATNAFIALGRAGFQAGAFIIEQFAYKESTLASLKLMLGSQEQAQQFFNRALAFGKKTPFETQDVVNAFKQLKGAGFNMKETEVLFQGVGDIASSSGTGGEGMGRLIVALSQIRGRGKLLTEELNQFMEVASLGGVSRQMVFERLGKAKGVDAKSVQDLISKGQIDSSLGIWALMDSVRQVGGGELGQQILNQSYTINGLLSTLRSAPGDFIQSLDLDKMPGLSAFKGALQNVVDLLDTSSESGKKMQQILEESFNAVSTQIFGAFEGEAGKKRMTAAIQEVLDFITKTDWKGAWHSAKETFNAVATVVRGIGYAFTFVGSIFNFVGTMIGTSLGVIWNMVTSLWDHVAAFFNKIGRAWELVKQGEFVAAGRAVADGYRDGLLGGSTGVIKQGQGMAFAYKEAWKDALQIRSPSKVMEELGRFTTQGFAVGLDRGMPSVDASMKQVVKMVPDALAPSIGGAGGAAAGARGGHVEMHFHAPLASFDGSALEGKDTASIVELVSDAVVSKIASAFESLAIEAGAVGATS